MCLSVQHAQNNLIRLPLVPGSGFWHMWKFILQLLNSNCGQIEGVLILCQHVKAPYYFTILFEYAEKKNQSPSKRILKSVISYFYRHSYTEEEEIPVNWELSLLRI